MSVKPYRNRGLSVTLHGISGRIYLKEENQIQRNVNKREEDEIGRICRTRGGMISKYKMLAGKPEGRRQPGRSRPRRNIASK
jgi:hypothetical protein